MPRSSGSTAHRSESGSAGGRELHPNDKRSRLVGVWVTPNDWQYLQNRKDEFGSVSAFLMHLIRVSKRVPLKLKGNADVDET